MTFNLRSKSLRQIARFGLVGLLSTLVHAASGYSAVAWFGLTGLQGNVAGFLCAWSFSFTGHYFVTFEAPCGLACALMRFVPHSLAMFAIGMACTAAVSIGVPMVPDTVLPAIGATIVPVISFISSKFFVFREPSNAPQNSAKPHS